MSIFKETMEYYKALKHQKKMQKLALNTSIDLGLLEEVIQRINANPNLVVTVYPKDGGKIEVMTYNKRVRRDWQLINGQDNNVYNYGAER